MSIVGTMLTFLSLVGMDAMETYRDIFRNALTSVTKAKITTDKFKT